MAKQPVVHLYGTKGASAVCGFDWMAARPRADAVSWTNRGKATCKRCLSIASTALNTLPEVK